MNKILSSGLVVGAMISLVGCGGGGTDAVLTEAEKISVSGTAVDELILNGKVKVSKPDNALLVEGRTDAANGTYTLNVENYTGATVVNVTCDADSKILVGTTEEACPAGLDLNSVANINGTAVTINISPLTDIVYQRAVILGNGEITEDSVTTALNQIAVMFGVDPIVNDPTEGTYEDVIEAFHVVAEADASLDLFDVIDAFVADMNDGVVDDSAALIAALEDANVTNPLTVSDTPYVVPENPASGDDVTEVKTMIQSLRTQATTVSDYANSEAEAMGTALDSVALDVQAVTDAIIGITDLVQQAREDGKTTLDGQIEVTFNGDWTQISVNVTQSNTNPNEWTYTSNEYTGTISIPEITEGMENTFTALTATFNGTLPYVANIYSQTPTIETQNVSLNIALSKTDEGADVTLSDFSIENSGNKISIDSLTGSVGYSTGQVFNYVKLDAITLSAVAGDYTATGTLSVPEYAVNTSLAENSSFIPKKIAFEGSLKNTVTNGELSGTVNIELLNAVTLDLSTDMNGSNEPALAVDVSGKLLMPDRPETLLNLDYETKVDDDAHRHSFVGSYSYDTTLITIDGSVDKAVDNANLTFTNGSGVVATFILENDTFVNGNAATATGSLVTKDSRVVATIEERSDNIIIIKYLDGSFESIF